MSEHKPMVTARPRYQDDRVTIHLRDALAVLAELPDQHIDALITDPPYSSGGMLRGDRTATTSSKYLTRGSGNIALTHEFTGDNRDQHAHQYWTALWLAEALRVTKPGGLVLLFTDWRQLPTTTDALQSGGWVWRGLIPWVKAAARPQSGRFTNQCEYVVWGTAGPHHGHGPALPGFHQCAAPRDREHITQKPVELMRALCRIIKPGGLILDPFLGSGTTAVAAILEGHNLIGCELVPEYADIAARRAQEAQLKTTTRGNQPSFAIEGVN
jgi:site-specific DNA-methyltransferase (adenine-specific)